MKTIGIGLTQLRLASQQLCALSCRRLRKSRGTYAEKASALLVFACLLLMQVPAQAQLISPGKLTQSHRSLEGISNCTTCHKLGKVGINNIKCLDCHKPLSRLISEERGFHATVTNQNCGTCHKDHFGRDFDAIRFDKKAFDHSKTGYELIGAHRKATCEGCHQAEFVTAPDVRAFKSKNGALDKTWLGLEYVCETCHTSDNVHEAQFEGQDCEICHTEQTWKTIPNFDHNASSFPLTGRHIEAVCKDCHAPTTHNPKVIQFTGLAFETCESCHEDSHRNVLGNDCATCHITKDWDQFTARFPTKRFKHNLTDYKLVGRHAEVSCASCHKKPARRDEEIRITFKRASRGATFSDPLFTNCMSCHTDYHAGVFKESAGGAICESCHGQNTWEGTSYDLERHNQSSKFELTGAHLATPCLACHQNKDLENGKPVFRFEEQTCQTCHASDNPHGEQFADAEGKTACISCHVDESWRLDESFDHTQTDFPLTGRHSDATCIACHITTTTETGQEVQVFRGLGATCESCHGTDNPHDTQFAGQSCETCHDTESFFLSVFDHTRTQFPLEGAHQQVTCGSCHSAESNEAGQSFIRYKPLGTACMDCHGEGE